MFRMGFGAFHSVVLELLVQYPEEVKVSLWEYIGII